MVVPFLWKLRNYPTHLEIELSFGHQNINTSTIDSDTIVEVTLRGRGG
ncbi:hypothetical protein Q2T40_04735 [Winogradskyella maritima]|nr:hypothetical protein [Winogradskyella maritima]